MYMSFWVKGKYGKWFSNSDIICQKCWHILFHSETCNPDDDDEVVDRVKLNTSLPEPLFKIETTSEEIEAFFADDEKVCTVAINLSFRRL